MGKLYVVPTPVGNLEDITFRALKVLESVDLIAAEDTRHTLGLLNHFNISKPLISYYKQNEKSKSEILISKLLEGQNIAVVSDAGTPGISDPGEEIVKVCIENGIEIVPIPGACAFVNALIASGFSTREFSFIGFLSAEKKDRKDKLEELKYETKTLIFYEAPHKLKSMLESVLEVLGNRRVVLARELTKSYEEFSRGSIEEILNDLPSKGEMVLMVEGYKEENIMVDPHQRIDELISLGSKPNQAIKEVAKLLNINRNELYMSYLEYKNNKEL